MSDESVAVTTDQADTVFRLALDAGARLADRLVARLEEDDAEQWLTAVLRERCTDAERSGLLGLSAGPASDACAQVRERGKRLIATETDETRMAGLALFALGTAAHLSLHGELPSAQPASEWADLLAELAAVAPEPWRRVADTAAERLDQLGP